MNRERCYRGNNDENMNATGRRDFTKKETPLTEEEFHEDAN